MRDIRYSIAGILAISVLGIAVLAAGTAEAAASYKILHSFGPRSNLYGCDGESPYGGLVMDASGNLYGTTSSSGSACYSGGVVFQLTPTTGGAWTKSILHLFGSAGDGDIPLGSLILDAAGDLFGTTSAGGKNGAGTVFELSQVNGKWRETILYSFSGGGDGRGPVSSLAWDSAGNLYGTTYSGGLNNCPYVGQYGCGTVFELTPGPGGIWNEKVLYAFTGGVDGGVPRAGVTLDPAGNIYGTTGFGGTTGTCASVGCGTAFELTPGANGTWNFHLLHEFTNGDDGAGPWGTLTVDSSGNLYGIASTGGRYGYPGLVFELMPTATGWKEHVLHAFAGGNDGSNPFYEKLVFDTAGNLYGTTEAGGAYGNGTLFELMPSSAGAWQEKILHNFGNLGTPDGANPYSGVILDAAGKVYGTTLSGGFLPGGNAAAGTVFQITP